MRHRQVLHADIGQHLHEAAHAARDIGLHGAGDRHPVICTQLYAETHHLVQFLDGARLGVHVQAHGAHADVAGPDRVEHPPAVPFAAAAEPTLEGPVHFYVPTKADVVLPSARVVDQFEHRIEVLEVVLGDHLLAVGVTHVEVRVVDQRHRPFALGAHQHAASPDHVAVFSHNAEASLLRDLHFRNARTSFQSGPVARKLPRPQVLAIATVQPQRQLPGRSRTDETEADHLLQAGRSALEQRQADGLKSAAGDLPDLVEHGVRQLSTELVEVATTVTGGLVVERTVEKSFSHLSTFLGQER